MTGEDIMLRAHKAAWSLGDSSLREDIAQDVALMILEDERSSSSRKSDKYRALQARRRYCSYYKGEPAVYTVDEDVSYEDKIDQRVDRKLRMEKAWEVIPETQRRNIIRKIQGEPYDYGSAFRGIRTIRFFPLTYASWRVMMVEEVE